MVDVDAKHSTSEPEAGAKEGKGLSCLPLVAGAGVLEAAPVEGATAAGLVQPVDEGAEHAEPGGRQDEVHWVVHEGRGEGEQPDQSEEDGERRHHDGVDLATNGADMGFAADIEEVGVYAQYHCGADELREAEEERQEARNNHFVGSRLILCERSLLILWVLMRRRELDPDGRMMVTMETKIGLVECGRTLQYEGS